MKIYKKLLTILIFIIFFQIPASATEYVKIDGEELFNDTAENIISGEFSLSPIKLFQDFIDKLFSELSSSKSEMLGLLLIAAISGILQALKLNGEKSETTDAVFFTCFTIMTMSALKIFSVTVGYGVSVIQNISDFITKLSPMLMVLLVSGGSVTSAAAFHPILSAAVYITALIVDKCIVPLVYLSAVLGIVGHITPKLQITAVTKLVRAIGKWILLSTLTIFTGITALYGFSAPTFDAVALKGLKFAVGSFVPIVGGILSDTVETVLSGTELMRGAVGTAGIITIVATCLTPILKVFIIKLMIEICAAASEPLTDKRIMEMLKDIAASVSMVLGMMITISMLFIITIAIILSSTR